MNVEIGTNAPIFLFWEYLFQIFGILSLQCTAQLMQLCNVQCKQTDFTLCLHTVL
jgi:hypothetical protein